MQIKNIIKLHNGLYELSLLDDTGKETRVRLSEDIVIEHNWYSNQVLTNEAVQLIHTLANYSKLTTKVLNYLSYKMRTEQEVSLYLDKLECDPLYKQKIIDKMKKLNYVNDEHYTKAFVKQHFDINKKGPLWIKNEMTQKGIPSQLVGRAISTISNEQMEEKIIQLIQYFEKLNKTKTILKLKDSIFRNLLTKGYPFEVISPILNQYRFNTVAVDEEVLLNKEMAKVKKRLARKYEGFELKSRVMKTLVTKGFDYESISSAYDQFEEDSE